MDGQHLQSSQQSIVEQQSIGEQSIVADQQSIVAMIASIIGDPSIVGVLTVEDIVDVIVGRVNNRMLSISTKLKRLSYDVEYDILSDNQQSDGQSIDGDGQSIVAIVGAEIMAEGRRMVVLGATIACDINDVDGQSIVDKGLLIVDKGRMVYDIGKEVYNTGVSDDNNIVDDQDSIVDDNDIVEGVS